MAHLHQLLVCPAALIHEAPSVHVRNDGLPSSMQHLPMSPPELLALQTLRVPSTLCGTHELPEL